MNSNIARLLKFSHSNIFSIAEKNLLHSDAISFDLCSDGFGLGLDSLFCFCNSLGLGDSSVVKVLGLDLPLGLQSLDNVLVLPADVVAQPTEGAELPAWLEPENLKGGGDDHPLLLVVWGWDTLEGLESLHGILSPLGLVGNHAPHSPPEHFGGGTEVEGAAARLDIAPKPEELEHLQLVPVEVAGLVDALAPHHHNLVAVEDVLGHDGGQTAHQVATAIDHHRLG